MFLGKPIFIWFGILGFTFYCITSYLGFRRKIKAHGLWFFITTTFFVLHILGVLGVY
jgi:hypothetical protein